MIFDDIEFNTKNIISIIIAAVGIIALCFCSCLLCPGYNRINRATTVPFGGAKGRHVSDDYVDETKYYEYDNTNNA